MILWKGKEREGTFKEVETLFVGSPSIGFTKIKRTLKNNPGIKQIYFGAGGCTKVNSETVYQCYKKLKDYILTAEININNLDKNNIIWMKEINLIITFINCNIDLFDKLKSVQIKLQSRIPKVLYVDSLGEFVHTDCKDLNGKKYEKDVILK